MRAASDAGCCVYAWWASPLAAHQAGFAASPYSTPQLVLASAGLFDLFELLVCEIATQPMVAPRRPFASTCSKAGCTRKWLIFLTCSSASPPASVTRLGAEKSVGQRSCL